MKVILALTVALLLHGTAVAQELFIYPAENQSKEQMQKDKRECNSWAKGETGFDPMAAPQATAPQPPPKKSVGGSVGKGGLRGGALGLGIGAITGSAGKGAARGALVGGTLGGVRSSAQNKGAQQAANQQQQQQMAEYQRGRDNYARAYGACLVGRGYAVE